MHSNDPCPCGSLKKYKRCCGKKPTDAPVVVDPQSMKDAAQNMDPAMMQSVMGVLQKMPKGQQIRFQQLSQKIMQGKNVTRELADLERGMGAEVKALLDVLKMTPQFQSALEPQAEMSVEQAQEIVRQAVETGKVSETEAKELLETKETTLWNRIFPGKKK